MDQRSTDEKRVELSAQLRKARGWILGVGVLMFVMDMIFLHVIKDARLPDEWRVRGTIYSGIILLFFVALWWGAQFKPRLCCILALAGFWAIHLYVATIDPSSLAKGLFVKFLFTVALVKGLGSAGRAERLQREIAQVFD
jgi:hypothetical protein